ncbi:hypothetical protein PHYPSEUDO_006861 [Phytophthora pseudosyringae]|uniref:Uncharacterized protein n=1 Tax=Phytophthora pseudosyringae TaxID=221518 RepID=A0A8T1W9R7_9STRA|nr:hypothetical protein PHYPSEUDO_006861 [Phytophthora pseudosyringae]
MASVLAAESEELEIVLWLKTFYPALYDSDAVRVFAQRDFYFIALKRSCRGVLSVQALIRLVVPIATMLRREDITVAR